jgi:alkyl hydroperoxide reductase subunit F
MYDLIIIGGGPAGVSAGIYAVRKKIKTLLITDRFGGQSVVAADIQNWIGEKSISGFELAKKIEEHLRAYKDIEILESELAEKIDKKDGSFSISTKNGKNFETKTILIASGSRRRRLGVPGEDKLDGKGVSWCSICDAPLFKGKDVAVIGGGNAGLEAVRDLLPYAGKIYLLEFLNEIKGDRATFEQIKKDPRLEVILMAETKEIFGNKMVSSLKYIDRNTNELKELKVEGVFIETGMTPNSEFVKELVNINKQGEIIVDHKTLRASLDGIWAAGDVCDSLYKQNNIAAGDATKAVLNIYDYLNKK